MEGLLASRGTDLKHYGFDTIRVKQNVFVPIVWAMTAFSFLFLPLRYWTRWRTFGRFFSDDLFALLAWLCATGIGALAIYSSDAMYYTIRLTLEPIDPEDIDPNTLFIVRKFSYGIVISFMLMYTSLWCVKLSFLLFFYRLGPRLIRNIKWHWWGVAVFTLAAYAATFATYPYMCSFGSYEQVSSPYCTAEQNMSFVNMKVNTALDVTTDVLIVTIPLNILWRSKIPRRQSLALGGVFSLVLVTITFAIVRATVSTVGVTKQMDSPWVLVWSSAEANIAIIVACIGITDMKAQ
ncbi:hypothetical protein N0V90_008674 [Kalmusia sp. IMI 367209]|nr:hypothetical protein N0V90_008674 [Kalmusia sp. IMI 367209]